MQRSLGWLMLHMQATNLSSLAAKERLESRPDLIGDAVCDQRLEVFQVFIAGRHFGQILKRGLDLLLVVRALNDASMV